VDALPKVLQMARWALYVQVGPSANDSVRFSCNLPGQPYNVRRENCPMRKTRSALGTGRLFACSAAVLLWSLATLRAAPLEAQPAQSRAFVECDREELIRAVPELASMQFDSTQDRLPGLLAPAAENLEGIRDIFGDGVGGRTRRRVIFSRRIYKENGASYQQVWTWNPADGVLKALTHSPRDHYNPTCDGQIIKFTSPSPDVTDDVRLWSLNPATGKESVIGPPRSRRKNRVR